MGESNPAGLYSDIDSQRDSDVKESSVLYRQISYEELEECVFIVRDSISEFYLAPQGEISIASVEAALKGQASAEEAVFDAPALENTFSGADNFSDWAEYENGSPRHFAVHAKINAGGDDNAGGDIETGGYGKTRDGGGETGESGETGGSAGAGNAGNAGIGSPGTFSGGRRFFRPRATPIRQIYRENVKKRVKKRRATAFAYLAACFAGAAFGGLLMLLCVIWILPLFGFAFLTPASGNVHEIIHTYEYAGADSQIEAIYEKISPSVVGIRVSVSYNDYIFGRRNASGDGSGIIIHPDGFILTSNHVIEAASPMYVPAPGNGEALEQPVTKLEVVIQRDPGNVYKAKIVARDVKTDIAVIKIDASNLPVAELGDSDQLKPGEMVIAIGRPDGMGDDCSVTDGIISGFNRNSGSYADGETGLIQTSAAINSGNSGGALVNSKGQVIGVNVITTGSSIYDGYSFAIPINSARTVADSLIGYNYVKGRARTGIGYSEAFNLDYDYYKQQFPDIPEGVYVESVEPLSGAFTAGIEIGDIITKMKGAAIADYMDMLELYDSLAPGDIIEVIIYRAGEYITMELEISEETGGN